MKILDRLPYFSDPTFLAVRGERVRVKPYQIVVHISVSPQAQPEWDRRTPHFPAILDTGNNHNLSIRHEHLVRWAGLQPRALRELGAIREREKRVPLHAAVVWLHRHVRGEQSLRGEGPYALRLEEGIAVYPDDSGPRLPVLGLRALTQNALLTLIDAERLRVTLRTPDWRTALLRWIG